MDLNLDGTSYTDFYQCAISCQQQDHVTSLKYLTWILGSASLYTDSSLGAIGCLTHNHVTLPKILHCTCIDGYLCDICHNLVQFRRTCSRVSPHTQRIATSELPLEKIFMCCNQAELQPATIGPQERALHHRLKAMNTRKQHQSFPL